MDKTHRVGTLTLGVSLIVFGVLFLLRIFISSLSYTFIFRMWPIIFILLGLEIVIANITQKENKLIYDKAAIVLTFILTFFAMFMSFIDYMIEYAEKFYISF
mgnify:FL=1